MYVYMYICIYTHTHTHTQNSLCCVEGLQTDGKTVHSSFKKFLKFADIVYRNC
jgi:hypothetical protein